MSRKPFSTKLIFNNTTSLNLLINITLNKLFYNGKVVQANTTFSNTLLLIASKELVNPLTYYSQTILYIKPDLKLYPFYKENIKFFLGKHINFLLSVKIAITWLIISLIEYKLESYYEKFAVEIISSHTATGKGKGFAKMINFYEFIRNNKEFCFIV